MIYFRLFSLMIFFMAWTVMPVREASARTEPPGPETFRLEAVVEQALNENPRIRAAVEKWNAARAAVSSSWDLKYPQLSYEVMGEDLETRLGPQRQRIGVTQSLPFFSKLPVRTEISKVAEKISAHYVLHAREGVRAETTRAYADLFSAQRQIAELEAKIRVLDQMASGIAAETATGQTGALESARVESEIARLSERMFQMEDMRVAAEQRLNVALGRPRNGRWPLLPVPELPRLERGLDELKKLSLTHRHGLVIQRLLVDQESMRHELAKMEYLPDFEIGFTYVEIGDGTTESPDDGRDAWSIPVKVTLPLWEPQIRGRVREAEARTRSAREELLNMENDTVSRISESFTRYRTASDRVQVYEKTWMPQSEQALDSAAAAFEGGLSNLMDVLDAWRMALEARIGYWRSYADVLIGYSEIEQVIGFPLDALPEGLNPEEHIHYALHAGGNAP